MKHKNLREQGFIPLLVLIVILLAVVVWYVYQRVQQAR